MTGTQTISETTKTIGKLLLLVGAVYFFLKYLSPLFGPFLLAVIFVSIFGPTFLKLQKKLHFSRQLSSGLFLLLLLGLAAVLFWLLVSFLVNRIPGWIHWLISVGERLEKGVGQFGDEVLLGAIRRITSYLQQDALPDAVGQAVVYFKQIGEAGLFLVAFVISTILLAKDYDKIVTKMLERESFHLALQVLRGVIRYLAVFVRAQVILLALIGSTCSLGLFLAGVESGPLFGLLAGALDALPFVGTGVVLIPLAIYHVFIKSYIRALVCVGLYVACIFLREILEPRLIGRRVGLPPLFVLISLYVGIRLFGVMGIIKGPLGFLLIQLIYKGKYDTLSVAFTTERDEKGMMAVKEKMLEAFEQVFPKGDEPQVYFAPGRVNLIGEHTDYNGGHVFPCALSIGTYAAVRKRPDRVLQFYSLNFPKEGVIGSELEECRPGVDTQWVAYPKGVIWAFKERGMELPCGLDVCIWGNIPNGSGLSSSASLEVLTGFFLRDLFGFEISNIDLALIGQYSENHYNGMNCGIMDQFASAMGQRNQAIFLDTSDLSYEYAPVELSHHKIVITNSKVKHKLVDSQYNVRRKQCEEAVEALNRRLSVKTLGELSYETLCENKDLLEDEILWKRAKHAVTENERTIRAVEALKAGNLEEFGKLMNQSHISLRDDYEVSCEEIDVLVEEAWKLPGVLGSRITGGGFGGCTVSIVETDAVEQFQQTVGAAYKARVQKDAEFYIVEIGNGPEKL